jgi:hypothetical protein
MPYKSKIRQKEYFKQRYLNKREFFSKKAKEWYRDNKDKVLQRAKDYYYKNRESVLKKVRIYREKNLDKIKLRKSTYYMRVTKQRLINDPTLRIKFRIRKRVWEAISRQGTFKDKPTLELLGCTSIDMVRKYIEKQFTEGMSWDNYGKWHIDHIKPISKFNLLDPNQQKLAFHYTNLQPLWAVDNLRKGDRTESPETTR